MASNWIHFSRQGYPVPNWDIAIQAVGEGYVPFSTAKNNSAGGRHVMDDFGNLLQALPKDFHFHESAMNLHRYQMWGTYGVEDTYFFH